MKSPDLNTCANVIQGDCIEVLEGLGQFDCLFADPPDNIGLGYGEYRDKRPDYVNWLETCVDMFINHAPIVWLSFNSRWLLELAGVVRRVLPDEWEFKPCVQTFTFGQHNQKDLGNCHRPLWRLKRKDAPLYPDNIRVPSWRQRNGDKRADPRGRVPSDVLDFPRVTGNSKQRRSWHPTQLHEGLVERCILLSTKEKDSVVDPFGGTGTTLRVCQKKNRNCTLIELDKNYCEKIRKSV